MIYAFIPCRSGSVRIPDKNLQKVGGRSLVQSAVRGAHIAGCDFVVVSTDDAERAKDSLGAWDLVEWHERPANLAGPHAQIEPAIEHWGRRANLADDDVIALIQPTSPFRRPESIRACVDAVQSGKAHCAVTVVRDDRLPFAGLAERCLVDWDYNWAPPNSRPRSQDRDPRMNAVFETGSVWAFTWEYIRETGARTGDGAYAVFVDWLEAFEIDTPDQLEAARALAPHVDRIREAM